MRLLLLVTLSFAACTRVDLDAGGPFLCDRDGGPTQCPGAWHCGLEGRCLPNEPGAWRCASADDCFGWACGLDSVCRPRVPGPGPCRTHDDCFGWRCGVNGACYDVATARSVQCRDDDDCSTDAGWRCGPDARCLDVGREALRPAQLPNDVLAIDRSPALWTGAPHLVGGPQWVSLGPDCSGARMDLFMNDAVWRVSVPDTQARQCRQGATSTKLSLPGRMTDVAHGWGQVLLRGEDGTLWSLAEDGGLSVAQVQAPVTSLRDGDGAIIGFSDSRVVRWSASGVHSAQIPGVLDVVEARYPSGAIVATTRTGLRWGSVETGLMEAAPNCAWSLLSRGGDDSFRVLDQSGLRPQIRRLIRPGPAGLQAPPCMQSVGTAPWVEETPIGVSGFCVPSRWHRTLEGDFAPWCGNALLEPDGGVMFLPNVLANNPGATSLVFAGGWPALFSNERLYPRSVFPITAPSSATTTGALVRAFEPQRARRSVGVTVVAPTGNPFAEAVFYDHEPTVAVHGRPGWVMHGAQLMRLPETGYPIFRDAMPLPAQGTAATARPTPDGGTQSLLALGDAVHLLDGQELRFGFVPLPRARVTSVRFAPDNLGARFAGGYVIASGRVFRFRADNPVVWRLDELIVSDEEAVKVFFDGDRGRVAARDGQVFSLPSRVAVAPPSDRLLDVEQVCQHTFALTSSGLMHLSATAGHPLGLWAPVLPAPREAMGGSTGLLHNGPNGLLVFWANGSVSELKGIDCAP